MDVGRVGVPQPTDVVWGVLGEERGAAVCVFI